jgi:hypothetical protein
VTIVTKASDNQGIDTLVDEELHATDLECG